MSNSSDSCCPCHTQKAYKSPEAAEDYGIGKVALRTHIILGNIAAKYPSSRPVIGTDELRAWFNSLPEEQGELA